MHPQKLTAGERNELIMLKRQGKIDEMKERALQLGVCVYYGTILERRDREPYRRSRLKWRRAITVGPVLA